MKKFVEPITIEMEESDKQEHPVQTAKPEKCSQPASTAIQPSAQTKEALPETSPDNSEIRLFLCALGMHLHGWKIMFVAKSCLF